MFYDIYKRTTDILGSTLLLTFFSPVMLISAVLIKLTSNGPVFVEKSNIKNYVEGNYNGKTIGNLVLASQGTTAYYEILSNSKPSGDLIRVPDKEITSTKSLVDLKENNEKRRLSGYSKDECESYKKAIEEARQSHITEWDSFN